MIYRSSLKTKELKNKLSTQLHVTHQQQHFWTRVNMPETKLLLPHRWPAWPASASPGTNFAAPPALDDRHIRRGRSVSILCRPVRIRGSNGNRRSGTAIFKIQRASEAIERISSTESPYEGGEILTLSGSAGTDERRRVSEPGNIGDVEEVDHGDIALAGR